MNLYQITENHRGLMLLAEDPEADQQMIADTLESLEGILEDKFLSIAAVRRNLSAGIDALKDEEDRLANKRRLLQVNRGRLESYLEKQMREMGLQELKAGIHEVKFGKCPPSVEIEDAANIPDTYMVPQDPQINKRAILDDYRATNIIPPGVRIVNDKESLRWK